MNKWNLSTLKNLLELSICQTIIGLIFSRLHKSMLLQHHLLPHSLKHSPLSSDVQKKNTKAFYLSFTLSCIVLRYAIWNSKKSKKTEIIQIPMSVRSTFGAQLAKFVQSHSSITKSKYVAVFMIYNNNTLLFYSSYFTISISFSFGCLVLCNLSRPRNNVSWVQDRES